MARLPRLPRLPRPHPNPRNFPLLRLRPLPLPSILPQPEVPSADVLIPDRTPEVDPNGSFESLQDAVATR